MPIRPIILPARTGRLVATTVAFAAASLGLAATGPPAQAAALPSQTFASTATVQWFTVPADVRSLAVHAAGGSGSNGETLILATVVGTVTQKGGKGGLGGVVDANVAVTPGERLSINVGSRGTAAAVGYGSAPGGSSGQSSRNYVELRAGVGNGGGATFVSRADGTPLVVAAGGGGGGDAGAQEFAEASGGDGGDGGHAGHYGQGSGSGAGGTGTSGQQAGGRGGDASRSSDSGGGAGGGGGWSPSGSGGGAGGAAGSSSFLAGGGGGGGAGGLNYASDSAAIQTVADALGDGTVTLSWSPSVRLTTSGTLTASSEPGVAGQPVTFTFNLSVPNLYPSVRPTDGTVTIGTYDLATGTEVPRATWIAPWSGPDATWTATFPVGATIVWASYSGGAVLAPFKTAYIPHYTVAAARSISVDPTSVEFGTHPVGSVTNRTVTITNTGALPWTATSLALSAGPFTISGGTCGPTALAPGAPCTFVFAYAPVAAGTQQASLTITDSVGTKTVIALRGTAPAVQPSTNPAPTVTAITPAGGPKTGGTVVKITGTNLVNVTAIRFGALNATAVSCPTPTSCTATSPAGQKTVGITVTTPAGTSTTGPATRFTYLP